MNREKAELILKEYIQPGSGLYSQRRYLAWNPGNKEITLDGKFAADELEAIIWWMTQSANKEISDKA